MSSKPFVYLDHNIFDFFTKNKLIDLFNIIAEKADVYYSPETINEIKKSPDYIPQFIDVIKRLKATYAEIVLDNNLKIKDALHTYKIDPAELFRDTNEISSKQYMIQFFYKFFGGMQGIGFTDIIDNQLNSIHDLFENVSVSDPEMSKTIDDLKSKANQVFMQLKETMGKAIKDQEHYNSLKSFRDAVNLGPIQFNNISPPNVIDKIWTMLNEVPEIKKYNISKEIFFKKDYSYSLNPNNSTFLKVIGLYSTLNIIGYYPDTQTYKEHRFKAFLSDQYHAAYGIFATDLMSRGVPRISVTKRKLN